MSLATRAAWLHYAGGLTQSEVAKRLGITSLKAHRLITRANQEGVVKVFISGEIAECVDLEGRLCQKYDLKTCEVAPDLALTENPFRALGSVGAQYLKREIESGRHKLIGIGYGRTLAACVDQLPQIRAGDVKFVSLLGGLTQNLTASPYDVIHRLARRTGTDAYVMPVPFFANTVEDRKILLEQRGIQAVVDLGVASELKFTGIGTAEPAASLVATGMVTQSEIEMVRASGGVGELLGYFFDARGKPADTELSDRIMSLRRSDLEKSNIVAIAGGNSKIGAIRSVLKSGYLSGLITDEKTAKELVAD